MAYYNDYFVKSISSQQSVLGKHFILDLFLFRSIQTFRRVWYFTYTSGYRKHVCHGVGESRINGATLTTLVDV